ncbi:hypothetical protein MKX01_000519 [Papaver californicum]|nr:hypothetical protein MKX01_000519 [Papaver californicum]
MASPNQFSPTHVVIALIFGLFWFPRLPMVVELLSSNINCRMLRDVCNQSKECASQCEHQSFHEDAL